MILSCELQANQELFLSWAQNVGNKVVTRFLFIRIKMVEIISKYTHREQHIFFHVSWRWGRKQNIFKRLQSEQSTKDRRSVGSRFQGFFFHSVHRKGLWSFPGCRNKALSCLCLVPSVPGSTRERALPATWPCRAPFPAGAGVRQGEPVPEHPPVTCSCGWGTAQTCASYSRCSGGGLFLRNEYSLLTLRQEYSKSWNFLSLVLKNTLRLTFSMFDFFQRFNA